jgi:hypothetical protein
VAYQFETIDVRISRRTLWIGSQIYPLQNVARIRSFEEVRDRGGLTWAFAKGAARTLGAALALLIVVTYVASTPTGPQLVVVGGAVVLLGWQTYQFVVDMSRANLHILVIESASAAYTAIGSPNRATIADLADKIAEAIENPTLDYAVKIDVVQGDQFNQVGTGNTMNIT